MPSIYCRINLLDLNWVECKLPLQKEQAYGSHFIEKILPASCLHHLVVSACLLYQPAALCLCVAIMELPSYKPRTGGNLTVFTCNEDWLWSRSIVSSVWGAAATLCSGSLQPVLSSTMEAMKLWYAVLFMKWEAVSVNVQALGQWYFLLVNC